MGLLSMFACKWKTKTNDIYVFTEVYGTRYTRNSISVYSLFSVLSPYCEQLIKENFINFFDYCFWTKLIIIDQF